MSSGSQFPPSFLDDIRARVRVSAVVGRRVRLEKRGHEFVGLSPFSHEKTPSFTVNDEKRFYHCFSTQEHGDIFTFVMKTENLTFPEAVEALAEEAGLALPRRTAAESQKAEKVALIRPLIEGACAIYEEALWAEEGRYALEYLRRRGLTDETIRRFRLGYAPTGNVLKAKMLARGVAEALLLDAKLIAPGGDDRGSFDFFRDRVIFPILDLRGRPVAFGGRVMGDGTPKYLNSADTPLFHKGSLLYGLSQAREQALAEKAIVLVEGYMDVIAMAQAGIANTVAPLGTALTENQIELMWRYSEAPTLCFDGDKAGRAAAARAVNRALPMLKPGLSLGFVTLPSGQDPDDICRGEGGADAMREILAAPEALSEVVWRQLVADHPANTPERRAGFQAAVRARAAEIKDDSVRRNYAAFFEERMGPVAAPPDDGDDDRTPEEGGGAPRDDAPRPGHDPYHDGQKPEDVLGPDAPIVALGHSRRVVAGSRVNVFHFLNTKGETESYSASALRTPAIIEGMFFGHMAWVESMAPNKTFDGAVMPGDKPTWKSAVIRTMLMRACDAAGFFEPDNAVRGPGVWPFGPVKEWPRRDPRIVLHTGESVYVIWTDQRPARFEKHRGGVRVGDFVYCRTRPEDGLADGALTDSEALGIIRFYECWSWEEKARALDVSLVGFLLFGWLAAAGIVALLRHRPHIFLRGPTKAGKSALCTLHEELLGSASIRMENATMTGIRNEFLDPQPVRALVCNEANERHSPQGQEQLREVLNLALYVYTSGEGRQLRGPGGISGTVNATFMFAAVRPPTLNSDDANRMLLLNMRLLELTAQKRADFSARRDEITPLGPRLRRRVLERWGDYPKTFAVFEAALMRLGYDSRSTDTYGTLMACAWIGSRKGLPTEDAAIDLAQALSGSAFIQAADEAEQDWRRCWTHLTTSKIDWLNDSSRRATVGDLIDHAMDRRSPSHVAAVAALKNSGLSVVRRQSFVEKAQNEAAGVHPPHAREWVAVSYGHQGLEDIFKGTDWRGGKWSVLAQMPGAEKNHPANFSGQKRGKATLIPIEEVKAQEGDLDYADDPDVVAREREAEHLR